MWAKSSQKSLDLFDEQNPDKYFNYCVIIVTDFADATPNIVVYIGFMDSLDNEGTVLQCEKLICLSKSPSDNTVSLVEVDSDVVLADVEVTPLPVPE